MKTLLIESSSCLLFAATPLGVITVPGDSDLETCRLLIERLHNNLDQVDGISHRMVSKLKSVLQSAWTHSRVADMLIVDVTKLVLTVCSQDCDEMKRECLSSQSLSKKWCFLDCE